MRVALLCSSLVVAMLAAVPAGLGRRGWWALTIAVALALFAAGALS